MRKARAQKALVITWKTLKFEIQHDAKILNVQIQTLREEIIDFIDKPNLPKYLQNKIAEYHAAKNERKFLHRLLKILNRNIRGAQRK